MWSHRHWLSAPKNWSRRIAFLYLLQFFYLASTVIVLLLLFFVHKFDIFLHYIANHLWCVEYISRLNLQSSVKNYYKKIMHDRPNLWSWIPHRLCDKWQPAHGYVTLWCCHLHLNYGDTNPRKLLTLGKIHIYNSLAPVTNIPLHFRSRDRDVHVAKKVLAKIGTFL